ncbi:transcript elongation factor IIS [Euphorbia peplus]|nr:transcript elongation factor IIS [Euphorbia peplus]
MEKLVLELVELASKTASKQPLESRCLAALSKLSSIPISNDFLLSTSIGHTISCLELNPRLQPIIRDYSSRVLLNWRKQLHNKSFSAPVNDHKPQSQNPIPVTPPKTSPKPVSESKNKPPIKVSESQKKPPNNKGKTSVVRKLVSGSKLQKKPVSESTRNTTVVHTDDGLLRRSIRQQVFEALDMASKEIDHLECCDPVGVSYSVESILYNKWGLSNTANKQKYRSFLYNLKDVQNQDFRRMVLMGEIEAEKLTELKPEDMASKERRNLNNNIRQSALEKCIVGRDIHSS